MAPGVRGKKNGKLDFARAVSDVTKDGCPDLYNGVAKRIVHVEEARKMGWTCYYDGEAVCRNGHKAAHYVSNPSVCTDCRREEDGKPAIYPKFTISDDLTAPIQYIDPVASDVFDWTPEIRRQFLNAWINTTSIPAALTVVRAQPVNLLDILTRDLDFKAAYDDAERKVSMVQSWNLEGEAADGSDRVKLAMAGNKFASFGAKTGLAGRPPVNAEEEYAAFAQYIRIADATLDQRARLEAVARATVKVAQPAPTNPKTSSDAGVESDLVGPTHDAGEVVSDTCDTCGLPKADASHVCGIEL